MEHKTFTDTYQTGSTHPPKSYRGLIAVLLVLVIFLCGIFTGLSLMNIRLFRQLDASSEQDALAFCRAADETRPRSCQVLGFSPKDMDEFWQIYQERPNGMYIAHVDENSDAAQKGILPGDVLLQLDDTPIEDSEDLETWLSVKPSSPSARVLLYREGKKIAVTVKLGKS